MVKQESSVYVFIGQDTLSKDIKLKKIKQEFLQKQTEQFNLDILYAKELKLIRLQEILLSLPLKAKKRIVVIREAQALTPEINDFLLGYIKKPHLNILLILDINSNSGYGKDFTRLAAQDGFVRSLARYSEVFYFRQEARLNTFTLSRSIDFKKADYALRILNQLLKDGEKPERILGGLRYSWQKGIINPVELKKRIRLLLNCDLEIKTGKLKPDFALERLVVKLCCL